MKTRAFKSGNSQAVRIPAEMAFSDIEADLEISRFGDTITIRPSTAVVKMKTMIEALRRFPEAPFGPVERTEMRETLWDKDR